MFSHFFATPPVVFWGSFYCLRAFFKIKNAMRKNVVETISGRIRAPYRWIHPREKMEGTNVAAGLFLRVGGTGD